MIKEIVDKNSIKYSLFGIPVKVTEWTDYTIRIRFLGLPTWKLQSSNKSLKIYAFGIKILTVNDFFDKIGNKGLNSPTRCLIVKSLELLNERKTITCKEPQTNA